MDYFIKFYFANKMLISLIVGMDRNSHIAEHGLNTGGGHNQLLISALHWIGELRQHAQLNFVVVAGHREESAAGNVFLVHLLWIFKHLNLERVNLNVRNCRPKSARPVDEAFAPVDYALLVHAHKGFHHGSDNFLQKIN